MPYLEELIVFGGEPFSCPITQKIIFGEEMRKHPQIHFSTISNGSLLDEKILDRLRAIRLGSFSFSLDSCVEKTYESIRCGAQYSRTMKNIENFVAGRDSGKIRIRNIELNCTIQKLNFREISRFIEYAHALGVKSGFGLITGFDELHDCIPEVRENIEDGMNMARSLGEYEAERNLSFLLKTLPSYEKKIKRVRVFYHMMNAVGSEKIVFFIRRHNALRNVVKKILGVAK
jgi:MoaA/NifB/PqqE/SkfB family radical SAM enzyme